jgi:hypothetical protein
MLIAHPVETTEIICTLLEKEHAETWWTFIASFNKERETLSVPLGDSDKKPYLEHNAKAEGWRQLFEKLTLMRSFIRENQLCRDFVEWAPRVARYSYHFRPIRDSGLLQSRE